MCIYLNKAQLLYTMYMCDIFFYLILNFIHNTTGIPAVYQRDLTEAEIKYIQYKTNENYDLSLLHASESIKSFDLIEEEEETRHQRQGRNPDYYEQLTPQVV